MPADEAGGRPAAGQAEASAPQRPLPNLTEPDTGQFWRATSQHRLTYQVCEACGEIVFHPRRHCTGCLSLDLQWRESAGHGTVYTYTVIRQHGQPYFRSRLPYLVGFIDLDEGFRMMAEIDAEPGSVEVGQRVTVSWEDHDELAIPVFRPAEAQ